MSRVTDAIAAALAADVEGRTKWDEPPRLSFLYLSGGKPWLRPVPVPDRTWGLAPPAVMLASMADRVSDFADVAALLADPGLHGAAFTHEAWVVKTPGLGTARHEEAVAEARARKLGRRPDRVECRIGWAVDRAGIAYAAMLERGEERAQVEVSFPGPARTVRGGIATSLERITASVLAVSMPGVA